MSILFPHKYFQELINRINILAKKGMDHQKRQNYEKTSSKLLQKNNWPRIGYRK